VQPELASVDAYKPDVAIQFSWLQAQPFRYAAR